MCLQMKKCYSGITKIKCKWSCKTGLSIDETLLA